MFHQLCGCLFVAILPISQQASGKSTGDSVEPKALIFGGNGFLGSEAADQLIKSGYNVSMVTRGNGYWDSKERIFSKVTHIKCDRNEGLNRCEGFQKLILDDDIRFDAVVDLTARYSNQIPEAVTLTQDIVSVAF